MLKVAQGFTGVDPLAGSFAPWSPYNYVMGNPISLIDPDGRSACPPGVDCNGSNVVGEAMDRTYERLKKIGRGVIQGLGEILSYTDADDATVLLTAATGNAMHTNGESASKLDIGLAAGGAFMPYASGSLFGKGIKALAGVDEAADAIEAVDDVVRVRHYTNNDALKRIKNDGAINPGGRSSPFGVDVEVAPFGNPRTAKDDLGAQGHSYIEFDANKNEIVDIPGVGSNISFNGRNTGRIPLGDTPRGAMSNPLMLSNRNAKFNKKNRFF